jgi:hypothetical protein
LNLITLFVTKIKRKKKSNNAFMLSPFSLQIKTKKRKKKMMASSSSQA